MKSTIRYLLVFFLLLIYIYAIVLKVFPVSTKIILETIAIIYCFFFIVKNRVGLKKKYIQIIRFAFVVILWDILINIINGSNQYHLVIAMLTPIFSIFAAHLIYVVSRKILSGWYDALEMIVVTIFVESIIAAMINLFPSFGALVNSIQMVQIPSYMDVDAISDYYRFIGLGYAAFYGVLPSCILGLVLSAFLLANLNIMKTFVLFSMFVVIAVVSFLTARTAIFIILLSFALYIVCKKKKKQILRDLLIFSMPILIVIMLFFTSLDSVVIDYAFGFILNKDVESGSAGQVIDWWVNTDFSLKTFLIGDALYTNPDGVGYYGGVDIGFYREIFYGGIVFLLMHLYYDYLILKHLFNCNPTKQMKYLVIALFVCHLVILAKGDASMCSYYILVLVLCDKGIFKQKSHMIKTNVVKTNVS